LIIKNGSNFLNKRKLLGNLTLVTADIEKNGGPTYLFKILRESPSLVDLPVLYQKFAESVRRYLYPAFVKELNKPSSLKQLKTFHSLLPKKLIKGILQACFLIYSSRRMR